MKLISFLTLVLFSALSLAGSVSTGSFSQKTISHGYSDVSGESVSKQNGSGTAAYGDILNGRIDTYTRADKTITKFDGESRTHSITKTSGSNSGINGSSVSMTKGKTRGDMDSVTKVNNLVSGDYELFTFDANGFNNESGTFSEGYKSKNVGYERYKTTFKSNSASAYTSY